MKRYSVQVVSMMLCCLLSGCVWISAEKKANNSTATNFPLSLPVKVSNNAVAYLKLKGQAQFYSFNGLKSGKSHADITNQAFVWQSGHWQALNVPREQPPVLASIAVTVGESVYLFGGYTVAADHSEKSVPNVWKIDGHTKQWQSMPAMPTPVDDTVALVYANRYIYLISGWHDNDNVDQVQVFDTLSLTWQFATSFPIPPVFGHAGALIDDTILVCDGVKLVVENEQRHFLPSAECVQGKIDLNNPTVIDWQAIPHHSGMAYYRMAAAGDGVSKFYFVAGSDNPYNYNGIGYNNEPAQPSSDIRVYDLQKQQWSIVSNQIPASMDHRGMLKTSNGFVIMGGMLSQQVVTDDIISFKY